MSSEPKPTDQQVTETPQTAPPSQTTPPQRTSQPQIVASGNQFCELPRTSASRCSLSVPQLKDILGRISNQQASEEEMAQFFAQVDTDADGTISRKEWFNKFGDADVFDLLSKANRANLQKQEFLTCQDDDAVRNGIFVVLHPEEFGMDDMSSSHMCLLDKKNRLLDVLGNDVGQQVIVTGDTSVGKSTIINFLLGFPVNFEATGVGTRRPSVISLIKDPSAVEPQFEVTFEKPDQHGRPSFDESTSSVDRVAEISGLCNSQDKSPHFFEPGKEFDPTPLSIRIRTAKIKYTLRLVDLPGMKRSSQEPMDIARSFIKPDNICVLVIGKDNAANAEWPRLASQMAQCKQVLCLQNFASVALLDAGNVRNNVDELAKHLKEAHPNFCLTCVDFGLPHTKENIDSARWQSESLRYPGDQRDWRHMLRNRQPVQVAMRVQAQKWSQYLMNEFSGQIDPSKHTQSGLTTVHKNLLAFQLEGIEQDIAAMQKSVQLMRAEQQKKLNTASQRAKEIMNPRTWHHLLSFLSKALTRYFDTTDECLNPGLTTEEEKRECSKKHAGAASSEVEYWFDEEMDGSIMQFSREAGIFVLGDSKIACLASWFRLLDEFSIMLAFSPMKCVTRHRKTLAFNRVGSGAAAQVNNFDIMVELLCDETSGMFKDSEGNIKQPIVGLLRVFKKRLLFLMERDIKDAFKFVEDSEQGRRSLMQFQKQQGMEPNDLKNLTGHLEEAVLNFARNTIEEFIEGVMEEDETSGAKIVKRKSGICVRANPGDAAFEGPLHWLKPFPVHYFNGQIPWKDLRIHPDTAKQCYPDWQPAPSAWKDFDTPHVKDDEELWKCIEKESPDPCINACNSVNYTLAMLAIRRDIFAIDRDSHLLEYDVFTIRTLRAMQGEIVTFWKSASRSMAQELFDRKRAWTFVKEKLSSTEDLEQFCPVVEQLLTILERSDFGEEHCKTVAQEIEELGPEGEWPGLSNANYQMMLQEILETHQASGVDLGDGTFPANKDDALVGQISWMRLADEFAIVIFQLASRNVTLSEALMAASSSGNAVDAGSMEIITKLILHRMSAIGGEASKAFKVRMKALYARDVTIAIAKFKKFQESHEMAAIDSINGIPWDSFLHFALVGPTSDTESLSLGLSYDPVENPSYMDTVITDTLRSLDRHIEDFTPIDPVMLNGRIPLAQYPLRLPAFNMKPEGTQCRFERIPEGGAGNEKCPKQMILDIAKQPLRNCWATETEDFNKTKKTGLFRMSRKSQKSISIRTGLALTEHMYIVRDETACRAAEPGARVNYTNRTFLKLDDITAGLAYQQTNTAGTDHLIGLWAKSPEADAPYQCQKPLAGGSFHFMMLRLHKAMHAAAIDYCRPRLRTMMSHIYQSDHLLDAFHNVDFAGEFAGRAKEAADLEINQARAKMQLLDDALTASK